MTDPTPPSTVPSTGPDGAAALPVIQFVDALPGLPGMSRCALVELDDAGVLFRLQSVIDPDLRLVVAAPSLFFGDYAPQIDDATAEAIGLTSVEDALVLVIVTLGATVADSTANLLAPIVVNSRTRAAVQVLQHESDLPLHAPLVTT